MIEPRLLFLIWIIFEWLLRVGALFIVPRNRRPANAMVWLMVIFMVPLIGWLVFMIFGFTKLPKNRRDAQASLESYIEDGIIDLSRRWKSGKKLVKATVPDRYQNVEKLSRGLSHLPVFSGNNVEPLTDYDDIIRRMIADIDQAKHFIYIEYYILTLDDSTRPFFNSLSAATRRGVKVRLLYDAYGTKKIPHFRKLKKFLKDNKVEALAMLPFRRPGQSYIRPDLRNHRKITVIDGLIGYTGSLNIIDRAYHRKDEIVYDELTVRATGPVVAQLELVFLSDWYAEAGHVPNDEPKLIEPHEATGDMLAQALPSGPGYRYENNLKIFNSLFYEAKKSITIVNPYFVPEQSMIVALTSAAQRGVKVRLVNSEAIDQWMVAHAQRSYYEEMLVAGVEIYLYKAPVLLHSKYAVIDEDLCFVGSSNMDIRSLELNQELTMVIYDKSFAKKMLKITREYIHRSKLVDREKWLARPPRKQLLDNIARLTSSLQ